MKRLVLFVIAATALVAGCGGDSDSKGATNVTAVSATGAAAARDGEGMKQEDAMKNGDAIKEAEAMRLAGTKLKAVDSEYGSVVANARGEALYLFDREQSKKSECCGACAAAWPPVLTKGKPRAGAGVEADLLGTTKRRNGKLQITYAGEPLYYYVGDAPGTILCHDVDEFGGTWLVVQPSGSPAP